MKITDLKQPILETWERIGGDTIAVSPQDNVDTETLLELCCDAGRLFETNRAAGRLASDLIDLRGWNGFVKLMKPIVDPGGHNCWG